MQALSAIKLAQLYCLGAIRDLGAKASGEALALAPDDTRDLKLRAEGNLVAYPTVVASTAKGRASDLMRLTAEAMQLGLAEHYTAIGFHNLGEIQLEMED